MMKMKRENTAEEQQSHDDVFIQSGNFLSLLFLPFHDMCLSC